MKVYLRNSASKKLHLRRIQSLRKSLLSWASLPLQKSARPLGRRRLLLQKMTRYFKRCSTVNVKTWHFFAKRVYALSLQPSARVRSGSWTSRAGARSRYRLAITAQQRVAGLRPRAAPSTCKTSSEVRSCAKQSWHRWGASLWSGTFHKLNRESSRGLLITKICSTSSGLAVTLMPRSVLRCSTYPAFQKKVIQTLDNLRSRHCLAVGTGLVGRLSLPSFSLDSLALLPYATTKRLQRSLVWTPPTSTASLGGTRMLRSSGRFPTPVRNVSC